MRITLFSLFPHWFDGPLGESILQRARDEGLLTIDVADLRTFAVDRHRSVDDTPYGGGGGMVIRPDIVARALDETIGAPGNADRPHVIHLSPRGRRFEQRDAIRLAKLPAIALLCGHYEAIDQRVLDSRIDEEISLGDFVLTGGEIPAMAVVDAVARMIPGVLGNDVCADNDSFMSGLLEGPHFTRPEVFEGVPVPEVLLSGNHGAVAEWREREALAVTRRLRPDLFAAQILWPEQVRRFGRRAKPLLVWEARGAEPVHLLFAAASVLALGPWEETARRVRWQEGVLPRFRVAEVREARGDNEEIDRVNMTKDLREALHVAESEEKKSVLQGPDPTTFLANLLAEIGRKS